VQPLLDRGTEPFFEPGSTAFPCLTGYREHAETDRTVAAIAARSTHRVSAVCLVCCQRLRGTGFGRFTLPQESEAFLLMDLCDGMLVDVLEAAHMTFALHLLDIFCRSLRRSC